MATVYYVSFGGWDTIDSGQSRGEKFFKAFADIVMIDGQYEVDNWLINAAFSGGYDIGSGGRWTVKLSTKQLRVEDDAGKLRATMTVNHWPMRHLDSDQLVLTRPHDGKTKYAYRVWQIE